MQEMNETARPAGFRRVGIPNCSMCREVLQIDDYDYPSHFYCMAKSAGRRPPCGRMGERWANETYDESREAWRNWASGREVGEHSICDEFAECFLDFDCEPDFSASMVYTTSYHKWTWNVSCFLHRSDFAKYYPGGGPEVPPSLSGVYLHLLPFDNDHGEEVLPAPDYGVPAEKLHSLFIDLRDSRHRELNFHHIFLSDLIDMVKEREALAAPVNSGKSGITVVRKVGIVTHSVKM